MDTVGKPYFWMYKKKGKMKKTIHIILLITMLVSCRTRLPVERVEYELKAEILFFPTYDEKSVKYETDSLGIRIIGMPPIEPNDSLSQFVNDWYSTHLYSLGEPVLYDKTDKPINVIRFTHLGTWSNPYSYRIEQDSMDISISYNKTDGQGGYRAGKRIVHETKKIDLEKWNLVLEKMESIGFWNMGTHDENMILDGAEWIFEALINGHYHFVTRNSPDDYGGKDYAELCKLIDQIYNENSAK